MSNFAITGAAGFVAPRHIQAIHDTGHRLVAALDPHDAAGLLDRYSFDVRFFTEFERFDRHLEKLRRSGTASRVDYVSVCAPNYLHDAHARLALRLGADVICEKPLVINPWNLDALAELEAETGRRVFTVLQLRQHPVLQALKAKLKDGGHRVVRLLYVTARGPWYDASWKGAEDRSGGLVLNLGIHLFDMLIWLFGSVAASQVTERTAQRASGTLTLDRAEVLWELSRAPADLPEAVRASGRASHRLLTVDGEPVEFSEGFTDLHTRVYEEILAGRGLGIEDARPSLELAHRIRHQPVIGAVSQV